MKIAIVTHGLTEWGGGIDLIRHLASFIESNPNCSESILILPSKDFEYYVRFSLYPLREIVRQLFARRRLKLVKRPGISSTALANLKSDFVNTFQVVNGGSSFTSQLEAAHKYKADVVFPCVKVPPRSVRQIPWVGYVLDFQHSHYPHFFSKIELDKRNMSLMQILNEAKHIVTYSQDTINDIKRFYPGTSVALHPLPFSPFPEKEWLHSNLDVREKYKLSARYFMISNQFWVHKDHETAFRAYAMYVEEGGKAKLVCTGGTTDFRDPMHFRKLQIILNDLGIADSVYILGHIPKIDQIALLKNSLGIIQPTLFEGGPGGGSSHDALSMGVPVIASNIPINLEMKCGGVSFFNAGDFMDLSKKMQSLELSGYISMTPDELWDIGNENKKRCGEFLFKVAQECMQDFKKK